MLPIAVVMVLAVTIVASAMVPIIAVISTIVVIGIFTVPFAIMVPAVIFISVSKKSRTCCQSSTTDFCGIRSTRRYRVLNCPTSPQDVIGNYYVSGELAVDNNKTLLVTGNASLYVTGSFDAKADSEIKILIPARLLKYTSARRLVLPCRLALGKSITPETPLTFKCVVYPRARVSLSG